MPAEALYSGLPGQSGLQYQKEHWDPPQKTRWVALQCVDLMDTTYRSSSILFIPIKMLQALTFCITNAMLLCFSLSLFSRRRWQVPWPPWEWIMNKSRLRKLRIHLTHCLWRGGRKQTPLSRHHSLTEGSVEPSCESNNYIYIFLKQIRDKTVISNAWNSDLYTRVVIFLAATWFWSFLGQARDSCSLYDTHLFFLSCKEIFLVILNFLWVKISPCFLFRNTEIPVVSVQGLLKYIIYIFFKTTVELKSRQ